MEPIVVKPDQKSFIVHPMIVSSLFFAFLFGGLILAAPLVGIHFAVPLIFLGPIYVGSFLLSLRRVRAAYRKTSYFIYSDRIVLTGGGVYSNHSQDIPLRNVTQVEAVEPLLQRLLFGTGRITVHAAGSAFATAQLGHVTGTRELQTAVLEVMKHNGFTLAGRQLVQRERPPITAVALAYVPGGLLGGGLVFVVFASFLVPLYAAVMGILGFLEFSELRAFLAGSGVAVGEAAAGINLTHVRVSVLGLTGLLLLFFSGFLITLLAQPLQLLRSTYSMYDDYVESERSFPSWSRAVIPVENLADVSIRQGLLSRLLRVANVDLSCQGVSGTITFRMMPSAAQFRESLRGLIRTANQRASAGAKSIDVHAPTSTDPAGRPSTAHHEATFGEEPPLVMRTSLPRVAFQHVARHSRPALLLTGFLFLAPVVLPRLVEFGMDATPLLAYTGIILLVGGGLIVLSLARILIMSAVRIRSVEFKVADGKVSESQSLVSRSDREFSLDKITAVEVQHSWIDRLFGTSTLRFYSIGAPRPLIFNQLRGGQKLQEAILRRLEMHPGNPEMTVPASFSLPSFVAIHRGSFLISTAAIGAGLYLGSAIGPLWYILPALASAALIHAAASDYARCRWRKLDVHRRHIVASRGWVRRVSQWMPVRHIRHMSSLQYALTDNGTMTIASGGTPRATLEYLPSVMQLHDHLDDMLHSRSSGYDAGSTAEPEFRRPALRNVLAGGAVLMVFVGVPLAVLGTLLPPLYLLLAYLVYKLVRGVLITRRTLFTLEPSRLVRTSGLLDRKKLTVLLDRIDHLKTREGLLNKLFRTGTVSVFTTGGSGAEMTCYSIPRHRDWHAVIDQRLRYRAPASGGIRASVAGAPEGTPVPI